MCILLVCYREFVIENARNAAAKAISLPGLDRP